MAASKKTEKELIEEAKARGKVPAPPGYSRSPPDSETEAKLRDVAKSVAKSAGDRRALDKPKAWDETPGMQAWGKDPEGKPPSAPSMDAAAQGFPDAPPIDPSKVTATDVQPKTAGPGWSKTDQANLESLYGGAGGAGGAVRIPGGWTPHSRELVAEGSGAPLPNSWGMRVGMGMDEARLGALTKTEGDMEMAGRMADNEVKTANMRQASDDNEKAWAEHSEQVLESHRTALAGMQDDVRNHKIDPRRVWHDKDAGEKVLGLIGAILGGIGAAGSARHAQGENQYFVQLEKTMQADADAQMHEYEAKKEGVEGAKSLYATMMASFKDKAAARAATHAIQLEGVKSELARFQALNLGKQAKGNLHLMLADINARQAAAIAQAAEFSKQKITQGSKDVYLQDKVVQIGGGGKKEDVAAYMTRRDKYGQNDRETALLHMAKSLGGAEGNRAAVLISRGELDAAKVIISNIMTTDTKAFQRLNAAKTNRLLASAGKSLTASEKSNQEMLEGNASADSYKEYFNIIADENKKYDGMLRYEFPKTHRHVQVVAPTLDKLGDQGIGGTHREGATAD